MLNLPVPKANFHNVVTEPSEFQQELVDSLTERANKIRQKEVSPEVDNMLNITNDGRKLGLDQRVINNMLPDDPNSKVNACVKNVYEIWQNTSEEKSTQMIFCDLSTPKNDGSFNIYDDIKSKLVDKGIPENQVAFIHDCKTDEQKQVLFTKVRNGDVRVLLGSTGKMGTGTNCQQKLKALHHLDCPFRPADLEQRNGRIIRQGNENDEVDIYRYATKGTFDSYLYQMVENKQKFISQIMTSKSPARSAEDVDEVVLDYAVMKAITTGNPKLKEKMDLENEVSKLKVLYSDFQGQKRSLQNKISKTYPEKIQMLTEQINGYEKDIEIAKQYSSKEFSGIKINNEIFTDKKEAGETLLQNCKMLRADQESKPIGEYKGFQLSVSFDMVSKCYNINLKDNLTHKVEIGSDALGNLTRIDNAINNLPKKLETVKFKLEETNRFLTSAKEEVAKPFHKLNELIEKEGQLKKLEAELMSVTLEEKNITPEEKSKTPDIEL